MTIKAERDNYKKFKRAGEGQSKEDVDFIRHEHLRFLSGPEYASHLRALGSSFVRNLGNENVYESPSVLIGKGEDNMWVAHGRTSMNGTPVLISAATRTYTDLVIGATMIDESEKEKPVPQLQEHGQPENFQFELFSNHLGVESLIDVLQEEFLVKMSEGDGFKFPTLKASYLKDIPQPELNETVTQYMMICSQYPEQMTGSHIVLGLLGGAGLRGAVDDQTKIVNLLGAKRVTFGFMSRMALLGGKEFFIDENFGIYMNHYIDEIRLDLLFR